MNNAHVGGRTVPEHTVPEYTALITEIEAGRFRAVLKNDPGTWTSSNIRMLDQRMRLEIGRKYHGGDGYNFDVRYLMAEDGRLSMISRFGPEVPLPDDSVALVLGPAQAEHHKEMSAWLRLRNNDDPLGRYLLPIIESHHGGAAGWCSTCLTPAPCHTTTNLVMHYIAVVGATIERSGARPTERGMPR